MADGHAGAAIQLDTQETPTLKGFEVDLRLDRLKKTGLERFAKRQHAERPANGVVALAQASFDHLDEAGRGWEDAAQAPDAFGATKHAGIQSGENELPQEQHVALRALVQQVHAVAPSTGSRKAAANRSSPTSWDARGLELENSLGQPILPEGDDGVGGHLARAERGQDADVVPGGEQVGKRRRGVIEEVGIIDEDGHRPAPTPLGDLVGDLAKDR